VNRIVADRLDVLNALAEKHGVQRLYLFGSALSEDFDPMASDLDFLVEFKATPPGGRADRYFGLLEDLEELFGRPVDLVERQAIRNPYFQREVEASKYPLYAAA
jgi:predicted nucleotidyltransferase